MQQLANNLWIVDGDAVPFLGLPYSTRMTIIRLNDSELWIHSPIAMSEHLQRSVESLGTVKFLIAPNHLHHLFLSDWLATYPTAELYGTDEVIKKRDDLIFQGSLNDDSAWPWSTSIDQLMFTGSPLMQECVFFHRESSTLIVTDLVENFSGESFNRWQRLVAKTAGILAPYGQTPIDWRLSFAFNKKKARQHVKQILQWQPEILVMAHGEISTRDTLAFLVRSFRWLL